MRPPLRWKHDAARDASANVQRAVDDGDCELAAKELRDLDKLAPKTRPGARYRTVAHAAFQKACRRP